MDARPLRPGPSRVPGHRLAGAAPRALPRDDLVGGRAGSRARARRRVRSRVDDAFRARAQSAGHRVKLHFVDAPRDVRIDRLARRNVERGETFTFEVTPAMF